MKILLNILTFSILTFSCDKTDKKSIPNLSNSDSLTIKKIESKKTARGIIYENENVRIVGDTNIDKGKIFYVSIKFEPYVLFEDFKASNIDTFTKAEINLSSHKDANNFRTVLREKYKDKKANFGGHYTFVECGCGVPCQSSLLIDRQTGRIFSSPTASLGYDYRANS